MKRINWKVVFSIAVIYFFAFERVLVERSNVFSYADEIFAIVVIMWILFKLVVKKMKINDEDKMFFLTWTGVLILGVIGNIASRLINNVYYIFIDVLSMVKVWLAYYAIMFSNKDEKFYGSIIKNSARIARGLVIVMFACLILSQFINIGMSASIRHGIASYKFIFNVPGNYSKLFYFIVPLLTADLFYKKTNYKKIIILISLITWVATMRSRAFAFVAIYIFMYIAFLVLKPKYNKKEKKGKIPLLYIIPVIVIALVICWNQIIFYFTSPTQARSVLLRYSIVTAADYYPIGAGFGTFGSDIAAKNYSELYKKYEFNKYYGMRENNTAYLNDNYWPMIIAQFGIKGAIMVAFALYVFTKKNISYTKTNQYFYVSSICANGFLILSSVASKSYCEFSSICVFMLIGLLAKYEKTRQQKLVAKEESYEKE